MNGSRAPDSGHLEHLSRVQNRWVTRHELMKLGGGVHLFPHVQVIIRGGSVCAEPHCYAGLEHFGDGGGTGGQLHVGLRTMRDAHIEPGKRPDVLGGGPNHMSCYNAAVKKSELVEIRYRARGVFVFDCLDLRLVLGYVYDEGNAQPARNVVSLG